MECLVGIYRLKELVLCLLLVEQENPDWVLVSMFQEVRLPIGDAPPRGLHSWAKPLFEIEGIGTPFAMEYVPTETEGGRSQRVNSGTRASAEVQEYCRLKLLAGGLALSESLHLSLPDG